MQNLQFGGVIDRFAASELCDLPWLQVDTGFSSVPLTDRHLRRLLHKQRASSHVFTTERDRPMTPEAYSVGSARTENAVPETDHFVAG
jgi:hypothetical protein